jgi:ABC-type antimicrobial peptide transport system permease subunit
VALLSLLIALLIGLAGGMVPSIGAARKPILEALKYNG